MKRIRFLAATLLVAGFIVLSGCDTGATRPAVSGPVNAGDKIAAERSKLSPEDRALVEAQEWCVVQNDERLGSMGPPIKVTIKGQPVFLCCGPCKKTAEKDPDATLAKREELKARSKAEKGKTD